MKIGFLSQNLVSVSKIAGLGVDVRPVGVGSVSVEAKKRVGVTF